MSSKVKHRLKLFVAGMTPGSFRAIENVREVCDMYLKNNYDLDVIDIYQQRQLLKDMDIIAVPTLVRLAPHPEIRIVGDLLQKDEIIDMMELDSNAKDKK